MNSSSEILRYPTIALLDILAACRTRGVSRNHMSKLSFRI
jgi:hypothetical protein